MPEASKHVAGVSSEERGWPPVATRELLPGRGASDGFNSNAHWLENTTGFPSGSIRPWPSVVALVPRVTTGYKL
jgi:hypothetical protein